MCAVRWTSVAEVDLLPGPAAAGVNASASDGARGCRQTGHRLRRAGTLWRHAIPGHTPSGPAVRHGVGNIVGGYALGWRVYDYAGNRLVFHGGAVQGYRGVVAMLPDRDFGIALMWNSESSLPTGLLPTMLDRLGLPAQRWLDIDFDEPSLFAEGSAPIQPIPAGSTLTKSTAAPR
jgi:beta-lactamase class C